MKKWDCELNEGRACLVHLGSPVSSSSLWKPLPEYLRIENIHKQINTIQSAPIINGRHSTYYLHILISAVQSYMLYPTVNIFRDPITFLICWMDF